MNWLALSCETSGVTRPDGQNRQELRIAFDKDHLVHDGNHDKFFVGGRPVEVPRHNEVVEHNGPRDLENL